MVVFPDPDGPIRVTFSPASMSMQRSSSTVRSPYCLQTSSKWMNDFALVGAGFVSGVLKALLQFPHRDRGGGAGQQVDDSADGEWLDVAEAAAADDLGRAHHLGHRDEHEEG